MTIFCFILHYLIFNSKTIQWSDFFFPKTVNFITEPNKIQVGPIMILLHIWIEEKLILFIFIYVEKD